MIVGISGYARAGKDSFGDALVRRFEFEKASFATPMKQMAEALDPYIPFEGDFYRLSEWLDYVGWEGAKNIPEVRAFLQRLGTEGGRKIFGEDFWVEHTLSQYSDGPALRLAICDVRFRNEAEAIRRRGGEVIRINRPGIEAPNDHRSEHDLDDYHCIVIDNDGTLEELADKAEEYFLLLLLARNMV